LTGAHGEEISVASEAGPAPATGFSSDRNAEPDEVTWHVSSRVGMNGGELRPASTLLPGGISGVGGGGGCGGAGC
jgi:hypothetical protein